MAASEASCSSRSQAFEVPMLSANARRRTGWHDNLDLVSDATNMPPPLSCKPITICFGIGATDDKSNSPLPLKATSSSVMHSSWIQRLKPSMQSFSDKQEPSTLSKKEDVVCTHFTKDYSSCSRRLNKSSHHTRSSSWPPNGAQSKVVMHCPKEALEPAHDIAHRHNDAAVNYFDSGHQNNDVLSRNMTQSSGTGFTTGSLFLQQQNSLQISTHDGFVPSPQPRALNAYTSSFRTSNDLQMRRHGEHTKPTNTIKVDGVALFQQAKPHSRFQEMQNKLAHFDNSPHMLKNVLSAPRLPVSAGAVRCDIGASADADGDIYSTRPFNFGVSTYKEFCQTRLEDFKRKIETSTTVVSSNKGIMNKFSLTVPSEKEATQDADGLAVQFEDAGVPEPSKVTQDEDGLAVQFENAGVPDSSKVTQNFNLFKRALVKASLLNDYFPTGALGDPLHNHLCSQKGCSCIEGHTGDAMTAWGNCSSTVATSMLKTQNLASESRDVVSLKSFSVATSRNPQAEDRGQASRSHISARSVDEDAARSHAGDLSLGDHWNSWVKLLEEPDNDRFINTGHSTAVSRQHTVIKDSYEEFCQQPTKEFGNFSVRKQLSYDSKESGFRNSGQEGLSLKAQRKLIGSRINSMQLNNSSEQASNFGVDYLELSQEQYLHLPGGASNTVDAHPHTGNSGFHRIFPDHGSSQTRMHSIYLSPELVTSETGKKEQNINARWLQRWKSSEKGSSMAEKPSAFFVDNSQRLSSDPLVKLPVSRSAFAFSSKGTNRKDLSPLKAIESDRGSDRYTDACASLLESGSACTPGFLPAGQKFSAFKSGYMGSSIEAMAIAGKSHSRSSQNGGFYRLPSSRHKMSNSVVITEGSKDADKDKLHLVTLSRLNDLRDDIGGP